ncbi:beta-glucosidase [bacterium]|nr:beta-glucosidase [bacterium]
MPHFPSDFVWGSATSCYQIEGGWLEGGKGLSIWDAFCHTPGKIRQGETGDVACDHYHRFKEDVAFMKAMGLPAYRFSLSWPRIQPDGREPNREGINFYSSLIDTLLDNGITPWATLYHWDLPLALQMECDGWLDSKTADHFARYAEICFEHFGDRVKHWITLNEPWVAAMLGYGQGVFAPGRVSDREPYLAAHNLLRAHGKAVAVYRAKYQSQQKGIIGMANNCDWREPRTDAAQDREAAERALQFFLGWFADPLYFGTYPETMRERVADRLPQFNEDDREVIQGSCDYFGLNHYTTMHASHCKPGEEQDMDASGNGGLLQDQNVNLATHTAWEKTTMDWAVVPWGCRKLLEWIDARYARPNIYITENGCSFDDRVENGMVNDTKRIEFIQGYLKEIHAAMQNGVPVKGYFLWSFMDNFEWALGYSKRFGIHYVDFPSSRRIPKESAKWYSEVIQKNGFST